MSQIELSALRARVSEVARRSGIGRTIAAVTVEADRDDAGSDFLRVLVALAPADTLSDEAMPSLIRAIAESVAGIDARYPSVRFLDAA